MATTSTQLFKDSSHGQALAEAGFGDDLAPARASTRYPVSRSTRTGRSPSSDPTGSGNARAATALERELSGIALAALRALPRRRARRRRAGRPARRRRGCAEASDRLGAGCSRVRSHGSSAGPRRRCCRSLPAVHALRLFGRLDERTDRSWMVFLARHRCARCRSPSALGDGVASRRDGVWRESGGGFVAFYLLAVRADVRARGSSSSMLSERAHGGDARVESDSRAVSGVRRAARSPQLRGDCRGVAPGEAA